MLQVLLQPDSRDLTSTDQYRKEHSHRKVLSCVLNNRFCICIAKKKKKKLQNIVTFCDEHQNFLHLQLCTLSEITID